MQGGCVALANLPHWSMHKVSLIYIRSIHYSNNCDLLRKYCSGHWTVWVRAGEGDLRGSSWNLSAHLNGRWHGEWHGLVALWMLMSSQGTGDEDTQRSLWDCTERRWCSTWLPHAYTNTHTHRHSCMKCLYHSCSFFERVRYLTDSTLRLVCLWLLWDLRTRYRKRLGMWRCRCCGLKEHVSGKEALSLSVCLSSSFTLSLSSLMWPSPSASFSSVFTGGGMGHSVGIRMHELFDNQSLL